MVPKSPEAPDQYDSFPGTPERLIAEIVEKVLTAYFEAATFPDGFKNPDLDALVRHFSLNPLQVSFDAQPTKTTLTFQVSEVVSYIVGQIKERFEHLAIKFKDGDVDFDLSHPDNQVMIGCFAEGAARYFLGNLRMKMALALDSLCEESIRMTLEVMSAEMAKDISKKYDYIPQEIDLRSLVEELRTKELIMNRQRILNIAADFEGLTVIATKGRPRTWSKDGLQQAVRRAALQFRKDKYRGATLNELASMLNRRFPDRMPLSGKSLGQMLKRYEINWKEIKNPHN